jgi:hypothetical protein
VEQTSGILGYEAAATFVAEQNFKPSGGARLLPLHFQISANTMLPAWLIRGEKTENMAMIVFAPVHPANPVRERT